MMVESGGEVFPFRRVLAVDADGRNMRVLSRAGRADDAYVALGGGTVIDALPGSDGMVLMSRIFVPEQRIGTHLEDTRQGIGVERLDTRNGSSRTLEQPKKEAVEYITDGRGEVRIMGTRTIAGATGYDSGKFNYFYRRK